jgi:hypothetical protein
MTAPRAPWLLRTDRRVARGLIFDLGVEFDTEQRDDGRVSTTGQTPARPALGRVLRYESLRAFQMWIEIAFELRRLPR